METSTRNHVNITAVEEKRIRDLDRETRIKLSKHAKSFSIECMPDMKVGALTKRIYLAVKSNYQNI